MRKTFDPLFLSEIASIKPKPSHATLPLITVLSGAHYVKYSTEDLSPLRELKGEPDRPTLTSHTLITM